MVILRIKVADGIVISVTYISSILLHLIYIYKMSVNKYVMKLLLLLVLISNAQNVLPDYQCILLPIEKVK
jgi:hypothetical protein